MKRYLYKNTYLRYLASYVLIMLLPTLILSFISYQYLFVTYTNEVLEKNLDLLNRTQTSFDLQVNQMNMISKQIGLFEEFSALYIEQNPTAFYDIMSKLSSLRNTNIFLSDILLHHSGSSLLYSPDSTYNLQYYINYICKYPDWSTETMMRDLDTLQAPVWRPAEDVYTNGSSLKRIITYITPIYKKIGRNNAVLICQFDEKTLRNIIHADARNNNEITLIYDKNGKVLFYSNPLENISDSLYASLSTKKGTGSINEIIAGKRKYIYYSRSTATDLLYVYIVDSQTAVSKITKTKNIFLWGVFLILVMGSGLIYLLLKYNYKPIKKLGQYARSIMGEIPEGAGEIETAQFALSSLSETSKRLYDEGRGSNRTRLLLKLLKGSIQSIDDFNSESGKINLVISGNTFRVVVFNLEGGKDSNSDDLSLLYNEFEGVMSYAYEAYLLDNLNENNLIFILSYNSENIDELKDRLTLLQARLMDVSGKDSAIGIGNAYNSPTDIYHSYQEARIAAKYRLIKGKNKIIFYSNLDPELQGEFIYPRFELEGLYNAIVQGSTERIEFIIEDLAKFISRENNSLFMAVCLCYDIINTTFKAMHDNNIKIPGFKEKYTDILDRTEFNTVDELLKQVHRLCKDIVANLEKPEVNKEKPLDDIIKYINLHFSESSFSVQNVAEKFGITISNLSHKFKSITGQNISDYINSLKIEKVKELLRTTDMPVNEIVQTVGYMQTSTFIRKFRQYEGKTPGEYRNLYKSE